MINPTYLRSPYALPIDLRVSTPRVAHRTIARPIIKKKSRVRQSPLCWGDIERTVLSVVALVAIAFLVQSYRTQSGPFAAAPIVASVITVTAAPGDTAWTLASHYESSALSGEQRLARIRAVNPGINISRIRPGMKLHIPVTNNAG